MRRLFVACAVAVIAAVGVSFASGLPGTAPRGRWVVRDLGTLGGSSSSAVAVNDRGQVVGTSRAANGEPRVFLWENGVMRDIGRYGWDVAGGPILLNERGQVAWHEKGRGGVLWDDGVTTKLPFSPLALNDGGQVVGAHRTGGAEPRAALWQNGELRDLGVLPGDGWSRADALDDRGVAVGSSYPAGDTPGSRAFAWQHGRMRDLGVLPGFKACSAVAVNDRGQVLGECDTWRPWRMHAFLWENGKMRDLAWPGADDVSPLFMTSHGHLNDSGQLVLWTREAGKAHAYLWERGTPRDLRWPGSDTTKWVTDLNERGQIVGNARWGRLWHAAVWQAGIVTDIAGGRSSTAADINNRGQIAGARGTGRTVHGNRVAHAVLWSWQPAR